MDLHNQILLKHKKQVKYCIFYQNAVEPVVLSDDTLYLLLLVSNLSEMQISITMFCYI